MCDQIKQAPTLQALVKVSTHHCFPFTERTHIFRHLLLSSITPAGDSIRKESPRSTSLASPDHTIMTSSSSPLAVLHEKQAATQSYQSIKVDNLETQQQDDEIVVVSTHSMSSNKKVFFKFIAGLAFCSALVLLLQSGNKITSFSPAGMNEKVIVSGTQLKKNQELSKLGVTIEAGKDEVSAPLLRETSCEDNPPNWTDSFGDECQWYEVFDFPGCPRFGGVSDAARQKTANEACCYCGGGSDKENQGPTPAPSFPPTPAPTGLLECPDGNPFTITLVNMGTNTRYDAAFIKAKERWESIIKCGLEDINVRPPGNDWFQGVFAPKTLNDPFIDDVLIGYEFKFIDGVGGARDVLGQAARVFSRNTGSAVSGIMQFDEDNFATESDEDAELIILHEMGHILGLVNIGGRCLSDCGPAAGNSIYDPPSFCTKAIAEYNNLNLGLGPLQLLTKEPQRDSFTCAHWAESSFPRSTGSSELMTPSFEEGFAQPISRVSVAALEESATDYVVDYSVADPFPFTVGMEPGTAAFGVLSVTNTFDIEEGEAIRKVPIISNNVPASKKSTKSAKTKFAKKSKSSKVSKAQRR